jgi:thioredoxin 1
MSQLNPLNLEDFQLKVLDAAKPVLVDFGASWCGPCRMLDPILEGLADEYGDRVDFYAVDVDKNSDLAMQFNVMGVPTVILFRDGEVVERITGFRPRKVLEKKIFKKI